MKTQKTKARVLGTLDPIVRHVCAEDKTCTCSIQADEPDEKCPVHGGGSYPPRCGKCGQFIKRPNASGEAEGATNGQ